MLFKHFISVESTMEVLRSSPDTRSKVGQEAWDNPVTILKTVKDDLVSLLADLLNTYSRSFSPSITY